jgi:hypothetical protein
MLFLRRKKQQGCSFLRRFTDLACGWIGAMALPRL